MINIFFLSGGGNGGGGEHFSILREDDLFFLVKNCYWFDSCYWNKRTLEILQTSNELQIRYNLKINIFSFIFKIKFITNEKM